MHHGVHFQPCHLALSAYCNADWAGDPLDRRSITGMLAFVGNSPITWSAKKQLTMARSLTEAEYKALASTTAELCWIRMILKDLGFYLSLPPMLWCDNVSALALASNPIFHARTKHIEVDYHYIREKVLNRDLQINFISPHDQLADIFTKALSSPQFLDLAYKLMGLPPLNLRRDVKTSDTVPNKAKAYDKAEGKQLVVE